MMKTNLRLKAAARAEPWEVRREPGVSLRTTDMPCLGLSTGEGAAPAPQLQGLCGAWRGLAGSGLHPWAGAEL